MRASRASAQEEKDGHRAAANPGADNGAGNTAETAIQNFQN
jgi:hypothetical protein